MSHPIPSLPWCLKYLSLGLFILTRLPCDRCGRQARQANSHPYPTRRERTKGGRPTIPWILKRVLQLLWGELIYTFPSWTGRTLKRTRSSTFEILIYTPLRPTQHSVNFPLVGVVKGYWDKDHRPENCSPKWNLKPRSSQGWVTNQNLNKVFPLARYRVKDVCRSHHFNCRAVPRAWCCFFPLRYKRGYMNVGFITLQRNTALWRDHLTFFLIENDSNCLRHRGTKRCG